MIYSDLSDWVPMVTFSGHDSELKFGSMHLLIVKFHDSCVLH